MGEALKTFDVVFHTHGFEVGRDITDGEWEMYKGFFMAMYNAFVKGFNDNLPKINDTWRRFEQIKALGDLESVLAAELFMDVGFGSTYEDWVERWMKETASAVDSGFWFTGLKGNIFRDGEMPMYGVKFEKHPGWTMDISIKEQK